MHDDKKVIYDFLNQNRLMTLATASTDGKPEAATIEYVMDGEKLLINTFIYYRKYANLTANPLVAGVVTVGEDKTLQFDATIEVRIGDAAVETKQKMLQKEPSFANYFNDESTRFFVITLKWARLRDYTQQPLKVTEITLS